MNATGYSMFGTNARGGGGFGFGGGASAKATATKASATKAVLDKLRA